MDALITNYEPFFKLILALVLGLFIGTERTTSHKTAGMRTFALVSMGSALFVLISNFITKEYIAMGAGFVDPLRMASQIIVGIGFLGAGLIIFQDSRIIGLTTAAGLWVAAGIGAAVGFGIYSLAIFTTLLTFVVFRVLWTVESKITKPDQGEANN